MFTVEVDINANKILKKRGLLKNGQAQREFTNEVFKHCDKYVPLRTGRLKNTVTINENNIIYEMPYARKQYYTNKGKGDRCSYWDKRMWNSEGDEILRTIANMIGGEVR